MSEGSGQPQRYCGNCGTEIRSGISFCVSCGRPVNGGPASPGPDHSVPPSPPQRSLADTLRETFSGLTQLFPNARSSSGEFTLSVLTNRGINWFRDLHSVPKLLIVGVLLLLLLTVLSPVARVVAIIVFVVSAVVLAIRAVQRRPLRGWAVAVVGSVVLIPVFGSVSGAIYGGDSGAGKSRSPTYETSVEEQSSSLQGTTTSGYSDYETAEREIRAEIRAQMDTGSTGYFRYIYYEEPGAPTETNDEIRSNVLAEYGFDCRPVGGGAMDNGRGGGVYQWIYDCNHVGTEDVGEWSDTY